ncbi:uncharacterized protein LOC123555454 [Mercenaria mercenaria]|uniref:uncharacterized protein LOC123555454 n=1 Tax=Mercenaria mercenaria TaxID=6596 RepID=UPI00234F8D66|nr:uncharacterized protein LOC123555454 [Mercenaria mercenaria]
MVNICAPSKNGITAKQFIVCFCSLGVITTLTLIRLTISIDSSFVHFYEKMVNTKYSLMKRHIERANHLKKVCKYLKDRVRTIPYSDLNISQQIYTTRNALVCVVPKSGCSFLKQIIYYLTDPQALLNSDKLAQVGLINKLKKEVFNLTRLEVHYLLDLEPVRITDQQFINSSSLKVAVARNPYSRLYSAYMDKVYVPVFYEIFKAKYNEMIKNGVKLKNSQACKDYISFEDFLEIILSEMSRSKGDPHWLPASVLCNVCEVKPDIVIKQETYYEDIDFFLSQTDISQTEWENIDSAIAKKGIQTDSIMKGLIQTMYLRGLESDIKCFSKRQIAQRVWEALKIQGQVYQYQRFPSKKLRKHSLTMSNVANVFLSQMKKMPITAAESKNQRQKSLARAYRNIRPELIIKIQALFYYDFMVFDYDFDPPK